MRIRDTQGDLNGIFGVLRTIMVLLFWGMLFPGGVVYSQSDLFIRGEELFMENKPAEAVLLFEELVNSEPENGKAWLYLGISFEQLKQYERAISTYQKALSVSGTSEYHHTYHFNCGNNYLRLGLTEQAIASYGKSIELNAAFSKAYLNRANLEVKEGNYRSAVKDYRTFLTMRPEDPQKDAISGMISLLSRSIQEEEQRKIEEERKKREEEARQKALLDQILGSLENAGSETTNLSAGTGETEEYEESFDIID